LRLATGGYAKIGLQSYPILTETNESCRASLFGEKVTISSISPRAAPARGRAVASGRSRSNSAKDDKSLFRDQYSALGKLNLAALQRVANRKYQRGAASNRQHPFVEVLFSDIAESGDV
jgi:hypothetical protein